MLICTYIYTNLNFTQPSTGRKATSCHDQRHRIDVVVYSIVVWKSAQCYFTHKPLFPVVQLVLLSCWCLRCPAIILLVLSLLWLQTILHKSAAAVNLYLHCKVTIYSQVWCIWNTSKRFILALLLSTVYRLQYSLSLLLRENDSYTNLSKIHHHILNMLSLYLRKLAIGVQQQQQTHLT